MTIRSSIASLNNNHESLTGNIEFWPHNYGTNNRVGVPGASSSLYDFGDERHTNGNYGSMQIHSSDLSSTIFALNRFNRGDNVDLGIGNAPSSHPDWTFRQTGTSYTTRRLEVFIKV